MLGNQFWVPGIGGTASVVTMQANNHSVFLGQLVEHRQPVGIWFADEILDPQLLAVFKDGSTGSLVGGKIPVIQRDQGHARLLQFIANFLQVFVRHIQRIQGARNLLADPLETEPFDQIDSQFGDLIDRFKERELAEGVGRHGDLPVEFLRSRPASQPCLESGIVFLGDTGCQVERSQQHGQTESDGSWVFMS